MTRQQLNEKPPALLLMKVKLRREWC